MDQPISECMSKSIVTIGKDLTLEHAKKVLYEHGIRHLPVLDGGSLFGIISDRDLKLAYAVDGDKAKNLSVSDACTTDVYTVNPTDPLKKVAEQMAQRGIGCAVITDKVKVVGIFTVTDACRVLSQVL